MVKWPSGAKFSDSKAQSAMEYLMTYGWSILIIAVVLAALFELGVFGNGALSHRAQPGGCRVSRPGGAQSTTNLNLQGICNNEPPEYAAQFNGQSSSINVGSSPSLLANVITIAAWVKVTGGTAVVQPLILFGGSGYYLTGGGGNPQIIDLNGNNYRYFFNSPVNPDDGNWHFVVVELTGNGQFDIANSMIYVDGQSEAPDGVVDTGLPPVRSGPVSMGGPGSHLNGYLSNVQIYNTDLSSNDVLILYQEGISGTPILGDGLVSWWPLNGDVNDYSGEYNNGMATNVVFTTLWTSGYTAPH